MPRGLARAAENLYRSTFCSASGWCLMMTLNMRSSLQRANGLSRNRVFEQLIVLTFSEMTEMMMMDKYSNLF